MNIYITFGGAAYDSTTELVVRDAPRMGADKVWVYDDLWLTKQPFYRDNIWLWQHRGYKNEKGGRGFGWFAWKPYIICHALDHCADGDIVMYVDGDTRPIHDFSMLYRECKRIGGIMLFEASGNAEIRLCNRQWCKRDCFVVMGLDCEKYWNGRVGVARFMLYQKGRPGVRAFLEEWQKYCLIKEATTFDPSVLASELPGIAGLDGPRGALKEHRTEQAILTNLGLKYGHKFYREACGFGECYDDDRDLYPQLFIQEPRTARKTLEGSRFRESHAPGI